MAILSCSIVPRFLSAFAGGLLFAVLAEAVPARAQEVKPPMALVAEGTISTERGEAFPALGDGGQVLFFATHQRGWTGFRLHVSRWEPEGWRPPEPLPFSGRFNDRAPFPSPDGGVLFFSSDRPLPGEEGRDGGDFNLWEVRANADGSWGEPKPVPGVNSPADDFHAAVAADGTLFFSSNRMGGIGSYDIYRAVPRDAGYEEPENLGPVVNTAGEETDVFVDPLQRILIVVATERAGGVGGDDLWITTPEGSGWEELRHLGPAVNSEVYEYGPFLSADEEYLYFTTHLRGLGDLVRVPVAEIPRLAEVLGAG